MTKFQNEKEKIAMIRRDIFPSGSTDGDITVQNLEKEIFSLHREFGALTVSLSPSLQ